MRGYELLEKMGLIDPKYIDAADKTPVRGTNIWWKLGAVAACIAILVTVFFNLPQQEIPQVDPTQPSIQLPPDHGGAGGGGCSAYDISQITNANPWYESAELQTLPIFDNVLSSNGAGEAWGADIEMLKAFALDVASRLGIKAPKMEFQSYRGKPVTEDSEGPVKIVIEAENILITVDQMLSASIDFTTAISLPGQYKPSHSMSYDEALKIAQYLKLEYSQLLDMDDPQISIEGDYYFSGEPHYLIYFYDDTGDLTEQILNYNFRSVQFWFDDAGISGVIINSADLSHKVADSPVISIAQAQNLLAEGDYITYSGYAFPGEEYIRKVELIYRDSVFDDYFLPYYCFYVEDPGFRLSEQFDQNLKLYSTYYVSAISNEAGLFTRTDDDQTATEKSTEAPTSPTQAPKSPAAAGNTSWVHGSFTATVRSVIPDYVLDDTTPSIADN